jgi:hypothetical protein
LSGRTECLDRIFVMNEHHLESVLNTCVRHYNLKGVMTVSAHLPW